MRYVNRSKLKKPKNWNARATAASLAVAQGANPNDYDTVWRELKDGLADLLCDKCWFCESPVDRADNAVEHFRPKNRVSDAALPHDGYRWLAFDESNYRYACTYCNSRRKDVEEGTAGGKGDRFPLVDEAKRVYVAGSVALERPILLDPCELTDWHLLGCCRENGQPCATDEEPEKKLRAETSIEIYHLHYQPTCNRRHSIAVQVMEDVEEGKLLFEQLTDDPGRIADFKKIVDRLGRAIDRDAIYSGDMHFLVRGQRSKEHPWIQELLDA